MPVARVLSAGVLLAAALCAQSPLRNAGFGEGKPGEPPPGWQVDSNLTGDYAVRAAAGQCHAGPQCLAIESKGSADGARIVVSQKFDAAPFRGQTFHFRAAVRAEVPNGENSARLMVEVNRPNFGEDSWDEMDDRPITSAAWNTYEISGRVAADAVSLVVALELAGAGTAWFDAVSFTTSAEAAEAARPLAAQGLENLSALARLLGFVRYFYPSDEVATADWNRFAVDAVRAVEPAASPAELASTLERLFAPVAPRVRVLPAGAPRPMMDMQSGAFVVLWQHRGLGPPQGLPPFFSGRFLVPAEQAPLVSFAPFHEPLAGGVAAMVPMALYRPQGQLAQLRTLPPPSGSPDDRAVRLAAVMVAWNVFQNFYPYLDDLGPVWMGALGPLLSEAARDQDAPAFRATLRKMLGILREGQSFLAPYGEGRGSAPGAWPNYAPPVQWTMAEGRITALSVRGAADVKPGDVLISIAGKPAAEVLAAKEKGIPGSTPQLIRERALAQLLAHAAMDKVQVELEPLAQPGGRRTVTLQCTVRGGIEPERPNKIAEVEPGIFYVDLSRTSDADFGAAIPALVKARGIVYDLRGPYALSQLFVSLGHLLNRGAQGPPTAAPIVTRPDGSETMFQENQWFASPIAPTFPAKRAFLTGGGTIGSAETLAAIAERYRLGEVVGETTGGDAGTLNSFSLPGGYEMTFTGERVRQYDGSALFGAGIRPTIPVSPTRAGIAAGRDEVLERGLQVVK